MNITKTRAKVISWKPLSTDGRRQRHSNKKQMQTVCISLRQLKLKLILIHVCAYHSDKPSNESEVYKVIRVNTRGWINL